MMRERFVGASQKQTRPSSSAWRFASEYVAGKSPVKLDAATFSFGERPWNSTA